MAREASGIAEGLGHRPMPAVSEVDAIAEAVSQNITFYAYLSRKVSESQSFEYMNEQTDLVEL